MGRVFSGSISEETHLYPIVYHLIITPNQSSNDRAVRGMKLNGVFNMNGSGAYDPNF